jgi:hypothetical protein
MKPLFWNMEKRRYPPDAMRSLAHIVTHDKDWVMECSVPKRMIQRSTVTIGRLTSLKISFILPLQELWARGGSLRKPNVCKDAAMPLFMIRGTGSLLLAIQLERLMEYINQRAFGAY